MTADDHRSGASASAPTPWDNYPEERAATEAQLEGCPDCRAEANALSPIAAMLERADPDQLSPAPAPPRILGDRIARRIAAERRATRRRRVRSASGSEPRRRPRRPGSCSRSPLRITRSRPRRETVAINELPGRVRHAGLEPRPWGSDVSLDVYGVRPGTLARMAAARGRTGCPPDRSVTSTPGTATRRS